MTKKEFLSYDTVRNDAIKLADKIYKEDGFVPDVIYASLRGGAYMANVMSEYFKIARPNEKPVLFAAVVARSYTDIHESGRIRIDGWTYSPEHLRSGDKILLVDDIFDSGRTLNFLAEVIMEHGVPRKDIKIAVHDFKNFLFRPPLPVRPDYYCRKIDISSPEEDRWIHYLSHELVGLTKEELESEYFKYDSSLRAIFSRLERDKQ